MTKPIKLTYAQAQQLPIGSVLEAGKDSHSLVTDAGIRYFDYKWYKTKFDFDPASWAVGVADTNCGQKYILVATIDFKHSIIELDKSNDRYAKNKPKI